MGADEPGSWGVDVFGRLVYVLGIERGWIADRGNDVLPRYAAWAKGMSFTFYCDTEVEARDWVEMSAAADLL